MMQWFEKIFGDSFLYHVAIGVVIVATFYLLSGIAKKLLGWIGKKVLAKTETILDDLVLDVVKKNVRSLMLLMGLHVGVREVRKGITAADVTVHQILDYCDALLFTVAVIVVIKIVVGVVRVFIDWYLARLSADPESELKHTLGPLTGKIVSIVLGMVGIIVILDHFGVNIGSMLVSLGVGSLAVALAAQDTLANMIAGFVILADRPFRVGDRIELPSGEIGDVQGIGLRSTRILNFDANLIIIPNADLVKGRITNFAYPFSQTRILLRVNVAYGTDPEKVRNILLALVKQVPDVLPDPEPRVDVTEMRDSALEFTLSGRVSNFTKRFETEAWLREQAYLTFQREGIENPFPHHVVQLKGNSHGPEDARA